MLIQDAEDAGHEDGEMRNRMTGMSWILIASSGSRIRFGETRTHTCGVTVEMGSEGADAKAPHTGMLCEVHGYEWLSVGSNTASKSR